MSLGLLLSSIHRVAVDKVSFFLRMCVQIHIEAQSLVFTVELTHFFDSKYCRLAINIRFNVEPIKILTEGVHPVMTVVHSVWV